MALAIWIYLYAGLHMQFSSEAIFDLQYPKPIGDDVAFLIGSDGHYFLHYGRTDSPTNLSDILQVVLDDTL